jgi:hypothetical protein
MHKNIFVAVFGKDFIEKKENTQATAESLTNFITLKIEKNCIRNNTTDKAKVNDTNRSDL